MDQRDWEDALFSAEAEGRIGDRALLLGLRLSRVTAWGTATPGVYWQGETLWDELNVSKSQFYRGREELLAAGLLLVSRGNLFPTSPDSGNEIPGIGNEIPDSGTEIPATGTQSPKTGTYKSDDVDDEHAGEKIWAGRRSLTLGPDTTSADIEATFPGPAHFAERTAATFVGISDRLWPEATRPRFSVLVRRIREARTRYSDAAILAGVADWVSENRENGSIRSPGAMFCAQSDELFEEASRLPVAEETM